MSRISFRPRSFSEIIDAGFQIVRAHFAPLALLAAVQAIVGLVYSILMAPTLRALSQVGVAPAQAGAALAAAMPRFFLGTFIYSAIAAVAVAAQVVGTSAAYLGEPVQPAPALLRAVRRAPSLLGAWLLTYVLAVAPMVVVGFTVALLAAALRAAGGGLFVGLLALVGGLASVVWLVLTLPRVVLVIPVTALEDIGAFAAARRTGTLVSGFRSVIWGLMLLWLVFLVTFGFTVGLLALLSPIRALVPVLSRVLLVLVYPLASAILAVLYYDLRIRKEGYDIELMARQMGGPAPATPAPDGL